MVENFKVPKTSPEIAWQVFGEYLAGGPKQFVRQTALTLGETNPAFLDGHLRAAVGISVVDPFSAQQILAGSFFRYECASRELSLQGRSVPSMGVATATRQLEEIRRITEAHIEAGSELDAITRSRVMTLERDDPAVGEIVRTLLEKRSVLQRTENIDAFIEGAHGTHVKFQYVDPADSSESPDSPEIQPSPIPAVRRSIVREALLENVLDPEVFVSSSLSRAEENYPRMVQKIRTMQGIQPGVYMQMASLTIYCIMQEFADRGLTLPVMEDLPIRHPDPKIQDALDRQDPQADVLVREYGVGILEEIGKTNPNLAWGVDAVLNGLTNLGPEEFVAGFYGFVHQYTTIKTSLS